MLSDSDSDVKPLNLCIKTEEYENNDTNENISTDLLSMSMEMIEVKREDNGVGEKKRKNELKYAQNIRKQKRNSGEEYTTKNLKVVKAKVFENKDCLCSKKCLNLLNYEERKADFDRFWQLKDFKKQNLFLCEAVNKRSVKQRRPRTFEREMRKFSYEYLLPTSDPLKVPVCKRFFLDTFKISDGRLNRALNALLPGSDFRGKMPGSSRKTSEDKIKVIKEHISSFPVYESHLASRILGRRYLSPDLDLKKMYNLYVEKCNRTNTPYVNEWIYRKVFKSEFNLHFHSRKDVCACQKCDLLKLKNETDENEISF